MQLSKISYIKPHTNWQDISEAGTVASFLSHKSYLSDVNGKTNGSRLFQKYVNSCFLLDVSKWHLNSQDSLELLSIIIIIY